MTGYYSINDYFNLGKSDECFYIPVIFEEKTGKPNVIYILRIER